MAILGLHLGTAKAALADAEAVGQDGVGTRADPSPRGRAGSRDARLRTMVHLHFDTVWRALRRLGVPDAGADDAAQQVFLVAARRLDEIDPSRERQYLLGIALRVASDARHSLSRRREVPIG